jgi:D-sedoheptulose 7-phosphate isomerase
MIISEAIKDKLKESGKLIKSLTKNENLCCEIENIVDVIVDCFQQDCKLMIAGNGGSASQAEHIAGEFVGKFYKDREPLPCLALTGPTACLTAVGNDYGYDDVFLRQVKAFGKRGDIFIGLTTSGKSENILLAAEYCQAVGITVVGMTGVNVTDLHPLCDYSIRVPSTDVPMIQEAHIVIGHIIAGLVEGHMYG